MPERAVPEFAVPEFAVPEFAVPERDWAALGNSQWGINPQVEQGDSG